MKKFLYLISVVMLLFVAQSCTQQTTIDKPDKTEAVQTADQWQTAALIDVDAPVYLAEDPPGDDSKGGFFSNVGGEIWNVILMIVTSLFGALWFKLRSKIKDIGDLFLKAHEYTNDNRLSEAERDDLMNRFLVIIGKKKVDQIE